MNGTSAPQPVPENLANIVRRERTVRLFTRARSSIEGWLQLREARDVDADQKYVGRHESQRLALKQWLVSAARVLADQARNLPVDAAPGDHFDSCRTLDEAAVWLERVWDFYRAKFDQRDDPVTGAVVQAADEIVWSCYHPVMARALGKHRPQPLPFLASEYSPAALESDKPIPPGLRPSFAGPGWTDGLRTASGGLPVTLLRLPPWCIEDPWWLVFIAHEVGHHVQADLGLVEPFGTAIELAATAAGEPAGQWNQWSREVFADVFSIMMVGRGAVHAIAEVERSTAIRMRAPTAAYPPPIVRLQLMHRIADLLKLPGHAAAADATISPSTAAVAEASLATLPVIDTTLADLCDLQVKRFGPAGAVATWSDRLLTTEVFAGVPTPDTARLVIAGSLEAWERVAVMPDLVAREERRAALAGRTIAALRRSTAPGKRAPLIAAGSPPDPQRFVDALLEAAHTYGAGQGAAE